MPLKLTMQDIARLTGVSRPVVSAVLNNNFSSVRVSEAIRTKVRACATEHNFFCNAAARSLKTQLRRNLGFMLADDVQGGWENLYYARALNGAEAYCSSRDYRLSIFRYNLSNLDNFVFPRNVGEHTMDGLIINGYVSREIIRKFLDFGIPCVTVGDTTAIDGVIANVRGDFAGGCIAAVIRLVARGRRRISFCASHTRCGQYYLRAVQEHLARNGPECELKVYSPEGYSDNYDDAQPFLDYWSALPPIERTSAVMASDQMLARLQGLCFQRGIRCPGDLAMLAYGESALCAITGIRLSSIDCDQKALGAKAAQLLIAHLEEGLELRPECLYLQPSELIQRESV